MEESNDDVPQITVETQQIRRKSSSLSESKPDVDPPAEKTSPILTTPTPVVSNLPVPNEANIKRIDSDSKFGQMETISLELSGQENVLTFAEAANVPQSGADKEKVEDSPLQMRSLSLNEGDLHQPSDISLQRSQSVAATKAMPMNNISKYFTDDVGKPEFKDAKGVEFFDAFAANTAVRADSNKNIEVLSSVNNKQNVQVTVLQNSKGKTEIGQEVLEDSNLTFGQQVIKEETKQPPPLSKFFSKDESGTDITGKAFFDKIAEETTQKTVPLAASPSSQFLLSPAISAEIEDAWIPSEHTRQILVAMITSAPGTFTPDKKQLTMPGVIILEEMNDPIKALLVESNSPQAQQRRVLTADDVTQDEDGLKKLIERECYHAAINLTKRLLRLCGQGPGDEGCPSKHTPLSLGLWYTRLALLVKLKRYSFAEVESAAFGDFDRPDLYYEFYPDTYSGKKGTMVPFSFRVLMAELPQYQGNHQIALDNLYRVLHVIQKILDNIRNGCAEDGSMIELSDSRRQASIELWSLRERRVLYSILNCILSLKDYILAVSLVDILLKKDKEHSSELYSALGRIYLQLGDVQSAKKCFTNAAADLTDVNVQVEDHINKALLAVALDNNEEAYTHYQQAYARRPNNPMLANNMAVCLLYMGRLKESLALLEKTIQKQPSSCLHDGILFNTCTLYELESSHCAQKKLAMLDLVSKFVGDGFNVSCLKIQNATIK